MALTYRDHVDRAHRAAALALTLPTPSDQDLVTVRRLHDDVTTTLAEATRIIVNSALGERPAERERAGVPAAREMLHALDGHPRLAVPTADEPSPVHRWSGRPADLAEQVTPVQAWKMLAAETFLARSCLDQLGPRPTTPVRAAVLTDLALTAEALATATADLATAAGEPSLTVVRQARDLASAAGMVQRGTSIADRDAAAKQVPPVPAARERRNVHVIRHHAEVAPALSNLARLTATGRPRAAELFATATMLGAMADALAEAMHAAAQSPNPGGPASLAGPIGALAAYRHQLAELLRDHQPKLASLGAGSTAALAQARELRTAGVPRLQELTKDPIRAASAIGDLHRIAATLAPATATIRAGFATLDDRRELLAYRWKADPGFHWAAAEAAESGPLLKKLESATRTVAALRPKQSVAPEVAAARTCRDVPPREAPGHSSARIVDLTAAIDRRRAALRMTGDTSTSPATPRCAPGASLSTRTDTARSAGAPTASR